MFWFPKYFAGFFNSAGSAFTLTASHPAHSQKQRRFLTHVEKSFIDPGRRYGTCQRSFSRDPDSALHPRRCLPGRPTLTFNFLPRGAIDTLWKAALGLHSWIISPSSSFWWFFSWWRLPRCACAFGGRGYIGFISTSLSICF